MGSEEFHLLYRLRSAGLAVAVRVATSPDGEFLEYRGSVLGLDHVFENVSYVSRIPSAVLKQLDEVRADGDVRRVTFDGVPIADEVVLYEGGLPGSDDRHALAGTIRIEDDVVEVVVLDEPVTLVIGGTVVGAALLICLAKLGLTSWLVDRADARRVEAGRKTRIVIDGTTDAEITLGTKIRARLRCHLRAEVLDADGKVVDSLVADEGQDAAS